MTTPRKRTTTRPAAKAPGWQPEETHYRLRFADPSFDGLVIEMRSMDLGEALEFDLLRLTPPASIGENNENIRAIGRTFIDHLVSWNLLDRDGQPVPRTLEGYLSQRGRLVNAFVTAWVQAMNGVSDPLDGGSTSGGSVQETSIPMESL